MDILQGPQCEQRWQECEGDRGIVELAAQARRGVIYDGGMVKCERGQGVERRQHQVVMIRQRRSQPVDRNQREIGDCNDAHTGITARIAEAVELFEPSVVEPRLFDEDTPGRRVEAFVDANESAGEGRCTLVRRLTAVLKQSRQPPFVHGHQYEIHSHGERRKIGGIIGVGHAMHLIS